MEPERTPSVEQSSTAGRGYRQQGERRQQERIGAGAPRKPCLGAQRRNLGGRASAARSAAAPPASAKKAAAAEIVAALEVSGMGADYQVKAVPSTATPPFLSMTPRKRNRHGNSRPQSKRGSESGLAIELRPEHRRPAGSGRIGCRRRRHRQGQTIGKRYGLLRRRGRRANGPRGDERRGQPPAPGHRTSAQNDFSITSALDTSYWPGCSTLSALTTPSSTSIE